MWRRAAYRILHPAPWLLTVLSLVSFPLTFYFLWSGDSSSWIACTVYSLAAYSLTALCVGLPGAIAHLRTSVHESRLVRRLGNTETARRMANDGDFRRSAVMLRGIAANAVYAAFRVFTGLRLSSVWFLSIAFYYAALAALKACVAGVRHAAGRSDRTEYECRCMEKISRLVLLIDLPMGVMIFQMVIKNSSYNYPGSMIYLSGAPYLSYRSRFDNKLCRNTHRDRRARPRRKNDRLYFRVNVTARTPDSAPCALFAG